MVNFKGIFVILLMFFSFSLNAQTISSNDCNDKIKNIFIKINNEFNESEIDAAERESLTTKVFDNILGKGDSTLSEKKDNLRNNLGTCFSSPLEKDIAIKILRILYGEVVNNPVKIISVIWGDFWDVNVDFNEENFNKSTNIVNLIPDIIKSYNNVIFIIGLFLLSVIYSKELMSLLNTDKNKSLKFFGKNTLRILTGFSMIAPLPLFEGYSLIQFIFIIMIILAVLISKVLWMFILLSINFSYYERDLELMVEEYDVKNSYRDSIVSNVMMHYCDIEKREYFINKDLYQFNNKKSLLEENEYYKCLQNHTPENQEAVYIPDSIKVGQECAIKYKSDSLNYNYYCGYIENFNRLNSEESQLPKKIYRDLGIESSEYQGILRDIAKNLRKYICRVDGDDILDSSNKDFNCPVMVGEDYAYNPLTDYIIFNNKSFSDENEKRTFRNSLALTSKKQIEDYFKTKLPIVASGVLGFKDESEAEKEREKLERFLSLYEKGFAMAGSVFYEKIDYMTPNYDTIKSFEKAYSVDSTISGSTKQDRRKVGGKGANLSFSQASDVSFRSAFILFQEYMSGDLEEFLNEEEEVKKQKKSIILGIGELVNSKTSCVVDFKTCHVNSINPFLDLMYYGNDMIVKGTYAKLILGAVTYGYNKWFSESIQNKKYAANRGNEILEFISTILSIYLLVGFFFAVLLPFIPFFTFAALFFGWILQTFKVIMSSQILSLYFLIPDENEDIAGKEKKIYKLLIKTALTPLFLLTGFIVTLIIANVSISLINVWLSIMLNNLNLHPEMGTVLGILNGIIGVLIYAVLVTLAIIKANEAIAGIPKAISQWLDLELEEEKAFNQLQSMVQSHILPHMKGKLFF